MSNKVILVVIDGLRFETAVDQMGYVNHLVEKGLASRYVVQSELPSMSRPLYEVLLTGTPAYMNGITSNQVVRHSHFPSLFHITSENGMRNAAAAYYWVSELYNRVPFDHVQDREQHNQAKPIQHGKFYFDDCYPDSHLVLDGEILRRMFDPHFLYIHPMGIDDTGHRFGSDSKEYRAKAIEMDMILSQLLPLWMEEGYHIILTSDHGMNADGMHGGTGIDEREVPLYIISSLVEPGIYDEVIPQLYIAPLVCQLLRIAPSVHMQQNVRLPGMKQALLNPLH